MYFFMKNKILTLLSIGILTFSLSGCSLFNTTEEYVEVDNSTDLIQNNELGIPSLTQELDIKGEDFKLVCDYDIGKYSLEKWHVTESKDIGMNVHTKDLPKNYEVLIEHVHADISLMSVSPQINGITQDSMDDTYHGLSQDGFFIDDNNDYYNIFSVEGYTSQFYELWGQAFSNFGTSSDYCRLTELNILKVGTYAEKLNVVYDIAIKKPNQDKYITKSVKSTIAIPISTNVKTQTRNALTGEIVDDTE